LGLLRSDRQNRKTAVSVAAVPGGPLLAKALGDAKFDRRADKLADVIQEMFFKKTGRMLSATGIGKQPDMWGTACAVCFGALDGDAAKAAANAFSAYQNGAWWSTATGRYAYALHVVSPDAARNLIADYIGHTKNTAHRARLMNFTGTTPASRRDSNTANRRRCHSPGLRG